MMNKQFDMNRREGSGKRKIKRKKYELAFGFKEIKVVVFKEALMSESVPQSGKGTKKLSRM